MSIPDIKAGDEVRMTVAKKKIEAKSRINWTPEGFIVKKVLKPNANKLLPTRLKLMDKDGEVLRGEVSAVNLQKVVDKPLLEAMREKRKAAVKAKEKIAAQAGR